MTDGLKLFIWPSINPVDKGEGGIRRVIEAQHRWLPEYGIELVTKESQADLIAVHADEYTSRLPMVYHNHGLYWNGYDWERWSYDANAKAIRMTRKSRAVSVPSRWVHNVFARGMLLNPTVLMHGIEVNEWEPGENMGYVLWAKNRPDPVCDPNPVYIAAEQCPDVQFVTTFGNRGLPNIAVTGKVNHERSRELIRNAAVYLATTLETGGITVLECAAAGVPAVGFRWGANTELILHGETGYLVEPGDYAALREGLYYCLDHRNRLGANAREHARQNFQWADRIFDYVPFYRRGMESPSGPKISIIVTAYNLEQYLPACLDSLLAQDLKDWECIIVDDASPDRCGEIADDYAKKDPRFKVIHNPTNAYLAEARNIGIRASSGQFVLPLDADDMAGAGALRALAESLEKNPDHDIVTGRFELINPDGTHWVSTWPPEKPSYDQQIKHRNQVPYASMYRRWVWDRTGGYRRRWKSAEDADFWTRAMSYGAVPAHVTDIPTLVYNIRKDSMSHQNQEPDWTAWYPWARYSQFTPFGAPTEESPRRVQAYHPPKVSVVIPCGPGHELYLQDVLDSLVAQTFQEWEAIVINDTGKPWKDGDPRNPLHGFPFARYLHTSPERRGVAAARNMGVGAASAPFFALLDADDYAQPLWLELLYKAITQLGGWCYSDWYDQLGNYKEAQDFDFDRALHKMPGPSTGIYRKADWELVGGFDESDIAWEDWSYQLSLMEQGICGVRVRFPGFTYRYNTGTRREDAHANQADSLDQIKKKHKNLLEGKC